MSVARFCVCGFLFPAGTAASASCPACGRSNSPAPSTPKVQVIRLQPLEPAPKTHVYKAVEVASVNYADDDAIPFDNSSRSRSIDEEERRRRRSEVWRDVREEKKRQLDLMGPGRTQRNPWNRWPDPGSLQDCITFPLRSIVWVIVLAWAWSAVIFFGVRLAVRGIEFWIADAIVLAASLIVLGFTHRLCQHAYASSCADRTVMLSWPTFNFLTDIKAGLLGFGGLLAGPIPVAILAGWFWLYGGRLSLIDGLILIELGAVSLSWWVLVVVSSHEFGTIHPRAIVRWCEANGWIPLTVILGAMSAVAFVLGFTILILTSGAGEGVFVQGFFLLGANFCVFVALFALLRWLGVRARRPAAPVGNSANLKWMAEQG